jgi:5-carboxymethyl-2-hydroxymuconate isomerase
VPYVLVEYSDALADTFDRAAFAQDVHTTTPPLIDAAVSAYKTRFRRIEEPYHADGTAVINAVIVEVAIKAGRTAEQKAALAEAVLALLGKHVGPVPGAALDFAVEVRDLSPDAYRAQRV